jgi:stage V sporulation protein B
MVTKHKAERNPKGESGTFSAGVTLCLLLTLPAVFILGLFGGKMTFLFSDPRCNRVFQILLIGLAFSSVYAVIRGYFWGNKKFLLPSIIEISEEAVMVIVGVLLLQNVTSAQAGAEKAAWAVVISYLFSFTFAVSSFFVCGGKLSTPKKQLKPLFNATLPITSVRAGSSFVNSAIAVLLPAMLVRAGVNST